MKDLVDAISGDVLRTFDDEGRTVTVESLIGNAILIDLQPDDTLVVETCRKLSDADCERVQAHMALHTDRKVLVLGGAHLRVLRETA